MRTGTALACIAQLAGVPSRQAVAWVRGAVETPWQRRYVERFARSRDLPSSGAAATPLGRR